MSREALHKPKNEEKHARNNSDLLTKIFPKNAARQEVINLLKKALDVFPDVVHILQISYFIFQMKFQIPCRAWNYTFHFSFFAIHY